MVIVTTICRSSSGGCGSSPNYRPINCDPTHQKCRNCKHLHTSHDTTLKKEGKCLKTIQCHQNHTLGALIPTQNFPYMAEHKNSHKGGCMGTRVSIEADVGQFEKDKTRRKYKMSIPLQEYQSLARSTNPDNLRLGNGKNLRHGRRTP